MNAGGLNPRSLALAVYDLIPPEHARKIAYIIGDDVLPIVLNPQRSESIRHLTEENESLATWMAEAPNRTPLSANGKS